MDGKQSQSSPNYDVERGAREVGRRNEGKAVTTPSFEMVTLKTGIKSLRCTERKETFHPGIGPWVEANQLHVHQQRLVERCSASTRFVIWDVGFGAAANVLAAIEALRGCACEIEIHSFDKTTAPIEFALA